MLPVNHFPAPGEGPRLASRIGSQASILSGHAFQDQGPADLLLGSGDSSDPLLE